MKWIKGFLALFLFALVFWVLHFPHGMIPPLGKLCNPFSGFWQNGVRSDALPETRDLPGLENSVRIVWDSRRVPHIFAQNDHDLYFAQGYVTARDRLWQMDFQARAAAGRLSEIFGKTTFEFDRFQRRIGLVYAAENFLKASHKNPENWAVIEAYTAGVNAWIQSLDKKKWPVEYKILSYKPEPWTPLKSALIVKLMAWDLTGYSSENLMTRTRKELGDQATEELFPYDPPFLDPVVPRGTEWDFAPLPVPQEPDEELEMLSGSPSRTPLNEEELSKGSNNWAVSGLLTESGYPILCNDSHLALQFPSVWYEIQVSSPGSNVYGVSLPGTPTVIIGFNKHCAWGFTHGASDVLDWYAVRFKDSGRKEYFFDGEWHAAGVRLEEIKIRGKKPVFDRVAYTHHGPVVLYEGETPFNSQVPAGAAMRWTGHDASQEITTFYRLNRAETYEDFLEALGFLDCPAQNCAYADVDGNIALWHNGKFPLKWKGQGRFILDGTTSETGWQGWVPREHVPHVKNPEQGYVSSANQKPADASYPYYLGWDYLSFERASRVNEILGGMRGITAQDMIEMQNDVMNLRAKSGLPPLLELLRSQDLTDSERDCFEELKNWDFRNQAHAVGPSIFASFWGELYKKIWKDEMTRDSTFLNWPGNDVTIDLILNHPESPFFDNTETPDKETLESIVLTAFQDAVRDLTEKYGALGPSWSWGKVKGTEIIHLARIPGLGRKSLETPGDSITINATAKRWGPSWRMVVALGQEVKAWGIYPGGQSGNPGSPFYDNAVDDWIQGKPYELVYLNSPDERNPLIGEKTQLRRPR